MAALASLGSALVNPVKALRKRARDPQRVTSVPLLTELAAVEAAIDQLHGAIDAVDTTQHADVAMLLAMLKASVT